MKKREASRLATSALDKSSEAVIGRINTLIDETNRQLDQHDAKMAQEKRRPKLVFPDPKKVGLNLPDHLVGNSADYRTEERRHGVNKDGFTPKEVQLHPTHTHTSTQAQAH